MDLPWLNVWWEKSQIMMMMEPMIVFCSFAVKKCTWFLISQSKEEVHSGLDHVKWCHLGANVKMAFFETFFSIWQKNLLKGINIECSCPILLLIVINFSVLLTSAEYYCHFEQWVPKRFCKSSKRRKDWNQKILLWNSILDLCCPSWVLFSQ